MGANLRRADISATGLNYIEIRFLIYKVVYYLRVSPNLLVVRAARVT